MSQKPLPDSERAASLVLEGALSGSLSAAELRGRYDLEQGLALQLAVLELWRARGERLGGYKVGFTSGRARDSMGPGFRPFGYILESRIFASGARLERARLGRAGIEAELGFRMARPLEGERASAVEARAAVATVAPAFELNQLRVAGEEDPAVRLADGLSQWGIVTGEERVPDLPLASLEVELSRDGAVLARADRSYPIDDHFESIAALARTLARFGLGLEAGHRVITGAYCRHALDGPGRWRASFAGVGTVELALA